MVQPLTLAPASAAATLPPAALPPASAEAAGQLEAFWRQMTLKTAGYLADGHGVPQPQAVDMARAAVAAVRDTTEVPDPDAVLVRCLEDAAALAAARTAPPPRPRPVAVAGLPMDPQPLAPVLIAPSPVAGAVRLWTLAAAAMLVPALAAFAALVLV